MRGSMHLERRLLGEVGRAIAHHGLIAHGDRIMVAMSGGKDSYTLFELLRDLRAARRSAFELVAVHLDQGQPGLRRHAAAPVARGRGRTVRILREDTYTVVTDKIPEGKTYCSLCSRLRRGVLYTRGRRLGCNKIALGHHRDDALETLLLNLFFTGKLPAMPPRLVSPTTGATSSSDR